MRDDDEATTDEGLLGRMRAFCFAHPEIQAVAAELTACADSTAALLREEEDGDSDLVPSIKRNAARITRILALIVADTSQPGTLADPAFCGVAGVAGPHDPAGALCHTLGQPLFALGIMAVSLEQRAHTAAPPLVAAVDRLGAVLRAIR